MFVQIPTWGKICDFKVFSSEFLLQYPDAAESSARDQAETTSLILQAPKILDIQ